MSRTTVALYSYTPVYLNTEMIFQTEKAWFYIGQKTFQNNLFDIDTIPRLLNIRLLSLLVQNIARDKNNKISRGYSLQIEYDDKIISIIHRQSQASINTIFRQLECLSCQGQTFKLLQWQQQRLVKGIYYIRREKKNKRVEKLFIAIYQATLVPNQDRQRIELRPLYRGQTVILFLFFIRLSSARQRSSIRLCWVQTVKYIQQLIIIYQI